MALLGNEGSVAGTLVRRRAQAARGLQGRPVCVAHDSAAHTIEMPSSLFDKQMRMIQLTREQRGALVKAYIEATYAVVQLRVQCLLQLDDEHPSEYVVAATSLEASQVMATIRAFRDNGLDSITG